MLIPYRVKNPWKKFPIATLSIIALNVLIYLLTTESLLVIRRDVVHVYAYNFGISPFLAIFSAMFLHENIVHIAGNMLFFWVFSPPVEDRLGIPRFLLVYFSAGILGFLAQALVEVMCTGESRYGLGASGCILGVMGAYSYLFTYSTVCVFYWFGFFIRGVWEIQAFWVIGAYMLLYLAEAVLIPHGSVANVAHVAGGVTGILLCLALQMKRDSNQVSRAKETQAEMKDLTLVPLAELEVMRAADPLNVDVLRAMLPQAIRLGREDVMVRAFREAGPQLVDKDPALIQSYIFQLHGDPNAFTAQQLMRLATHAESSPQPDRAVDIYQLIHTQYPNSAEARMIPAQLMRLARRTEMSPYPDQTLGIYYLIHQQYPDSVENEVGLYRMALCYWERKHDAANARACLQEMLQRYPYGSMEQFAKALLRKLPA